MGLAKGFEERIQKLRVISRNVSEDSEFKKRASEHETEIKRQTEAKKAQVINKKPIREHKKMSELYGDKPIHDKGAHIS